MASPRKGSRPRDFEEALTRLETIVKSLEGGDLSLEESLRLFEEGVSLTRLCAGKLEEAQRRIDVLTRGEQGDLKLVPFRDEADDEGGGPGSS